MMLLKTRLKNIAVNAVRPIALRLGFREKGKPTNNNTKVSLLENFFGILLKIDFRPRHIVDVGANHGNWTRETLKYFPQASYTLLEPQAWLKASIKDLLESNSKIKFYEVGAGEKEGTFKFTLVGRDDSCSFSYTEEEALKDGYQQIDVPVTTLNKLLPEACTDIPDIIKIDAEGLDIEVLKGASDFFGKTEVFMVEVGVVNKSFNNSFLNLINFMDTNGYRLFEITDLNRPFEIKVLWLAELVFVRKNGVIDSITFN